MSNTNSIHMSNTNSSWHTESLGSDQYGDPSSNFELPEDLSVDDFLEDFPYPPTTEMNPLNNNLQQESAAGGPSNREEVTRERFAFRTRSEVEILDVGFKWRKYGKKKVKNSPNPRNYFRCSAKGCPVKKIVERDGGDPNYVMTTYEGYHNHGAVN